MVALLFKEMMLKIAMLTKVYQFTWISRTIITVSICNFLFCAIFGASFALSNKRDKMMINKNVNIAYENNDMNCIF